MQFKTILTRILRVLHKGILLLFIIPVIFPVLAGDIPALKHNWTKTSGLIKLVDLKDQTIQITDSTGNNAQFKISPTTKVTRRGRPARIADLKPGKRAPFIRFDKLTREIQHIDLEK